MKTTIQAAQTDQAQCLSDLAKRSKAHWGYSAAFMRTVAAELTYTADSISKHPTQVLMQGDQVLGFYQLQAATEDGVELEALFVDPNHLRSGFGAQLFQHAVAVARNLGYTKLIIQSDPQAAPFYASQGCVQVGYLASLSIPNRPLPLFHLSL